MKFRILSLIILSMLVLAAMTLIAGCGGGGGSGNGNGAVPGAPVIQSLNAANDTLWPGGQTTVTARASHPDGDALIYSWEATGGQFAGTGAEVTWTAPIPGGHFTITLTVEDSRGRQATRQVGITVGVTVTGRVVHRDTGAPVAGITVMIDQATGTTDGGGRFSVSGVGQGTHHIIFPDSQYWQSGTAITVTVTEPGTDVPLEEDVQVQAGPPPPPLWPDASD